MTAIHNAAGTRPPLFVPQVAFELLVKHQIRRLKEPAMRCVDLVYNELMRIAACCESDELARFTVLRNAVLNVVHELLAKTLAPTHTCVCPYSRFFVLFLFFCFSFGLVWFGLVCIVNPAAKC